MAATSTNNIWEKVELALVRWVNSLALGFNQANVYEGHRNDQNKFPRIVCECHDGEVETTGRPTGNWICRCTITVSTKLSDETGMDNSGRFAVIMDQLQTRGAPAALSSTTEFFTCFLSQVTGFTKRIQGDQLVVEINFALTCCGSVIT